MGGRPVPLISKRKKEKKKTPLAGGFLSPIFFTSAPPSHDQESDSSYLMVDSLFILLHHPSSSIFVLVLLPPFGVETVRARPARSRIDEKSLVQDFTFFRISHFAFSCDGPGFGDVASSPIRSGRHLLYEYSRTRTSQL